MRMILPCREPSRPSMARLWQETALRATPDCRPRLLARQAGRFMAVYSRAQTSEIAASRLLLQGKIISKSKIFQT
jgi:hypothetical protein